MGKRETLKLDYEVELPAQPVAGQPFQLATLAQMHILGNVDPAAAAAAFNKDGDLSPQEIAGAIKDNMRGWLRYGAAEALKRELAKPGADPFGPVMDPTNAIKIMKDIIASPLEQWTFKIERLDVTYIVSESTMTALPGSFKKRLASMAAEADTAAAFGPFAQDLDVDVPKVHDPHSRQDVHVICMVKAVYTAHPDKARESLGAGEGMSQGALGSVLNENVRPWIEYAVKQAFYNALYEADGSGVSAVRDPSVMRDRAVGLCREALYEFGVLHVDIEPVYFAVDETTAEALRLQLLE
jgi:hypothetical protein